ncbi:hypothetical protein V5735_03385 (plasmid) [Haladaptatus sp. SPP-AMP-3]
MSGSENSNEAIHRERIEALRASKSERTEESPTERLKGATEVG